MVVLAWTQIEMHDLDSLNSSELHAGGQAGPPFLEVYNTSPGAAALKGDSSQDLPPPFKFPCFLC